ncbi:C-terminal processing protease CtpA/Prc, contains a PDZ domain [Pedobacter westerhofensis]|uniref:C-terminal processing protease CtpA/Prc, contains a PDZ domain n=1 Tax=Pedobacter westerhofensis TaxID=425512 RepID=A0A521AIE8_9SPHI|nr:S41 family peptidase [Pedobacter westerhofensis]SMO34531.1 C-terminal processing protease CtpA/Prc, contains a PDZ domain [Pedobacter westerhofensis]
MKTGSQLPGLLLMGIVILCSMGCRKLSERPEYAPDSQERINSWVLDSMQVYYYWNFSVPDYINFTRDPSDFFNILKNPSDRFSALVNPDMPQTYPPSLVHTLGFDLITFESSDGKGQTMITLVVPGSAAAARGLLRGDIIKTIDGVEPAAANITSLTETAIARQTVVLEIERRNGSITVGRLSVTETPVYTYKVFQSGGKTYGYLFLNSFEDPAVDQLMQAFSYFKQQQVQELVLDLRYNPGGSVPVAAALAAMIAPGAAEADTFVEYRGNVRAGTRKSSFAQELGRLPSGIKRSFSQFAAYRLGLSRVYILSGSHTASAAELTINALKPYLPVIQLGAKSLGKDMASFVIKDYRSPQLVPKWEIYPLVFKLYNSAGKGDYSGGLSPDQEADELSALPLKPFGDLTDPLLRRCLAVSGGAAVANIRAAPALQAPKLLFDSRNRVDTGTQNISVPGN